MVLMAVPEHIVCELWLATAFGVGFTSTVAATGVPLHELAVGVIVKVTVIGAEVVFVRLPLIFPLPLPEIPVTFPVLSLVQA